MQETACITFTNRSPRQAQGGPGHPACLKKACFRLSRVAVQWAGVHDDMGIRMFAFSRCYRAVRAKARAQLLMLLKMIHSPEHPDTLDTDALGPSASFCTAVYDTTWHARRISSWHGTFHDLRKVGRRLLFGGSLCFPIHCDVTLSPPPHYPLPMYNYLLTQ